METPLTEIIALTPLPGISLRGQTVDFTRSATLAPGPGLPEPSRGIAGDERVRGEEDEAVDDRLAHRHAIERVGVEVGQSRDVQRRLFIDRRRRDAVGFTLTRDEGRRRLGRR
jgi:hypothetical protein